MKRCAAAWALLLLGGLWPAATHGQPDGEPGRLELTYELHVYGIRAMRWQVTLRRERSLHQLRFEANAAGLADLLTTIDIYARAGGRTHDERIIPLSYRSRYTEDTTRSVLIGYGPDGTPVTTRASPPAAEDDRPQVPDEAVADAVDPLNAAFALLREIIETGECRGSTRIFDGRRLFALEMQPADPADNGDPEGLRCRARLDKVAGFKEKERRKQRYPDAISIDLAPIAPGGPLVPVELTADHRAGPVRVTLADVQGDRRALAEGLRGRAGAANGPGRTVGSLAR